MSVARSERRAALREALKLAQKAAKANAAVNPTAAIDPSALAAAAVATAFTSTAAAAGAATVFAPAFEPEEKDSTTYTASDAQIAANRLNAQKSQGPVTPEGRAKSSLNAVKTGLTGRTVLLPTDDAAKYQAHISRYFAGLAPATDEEHSLVQLIADANWRLLRISPLEAGIYAVGRRKLAHLFPEETDPVNRESLIEAEIFMTFRKDLTNLALQENRLNRQLEKNMARLQTLQEQRRSRDREGLVKAMKLHDQLKKEGQPFDPAEFGFEFTKDEFNYWMERADKQFRLIGTRPSFEKLIAEYRKSTEPRL